MDLASAKRTGPEFSAMSTLYVIAYVTSVNALDQVHHYVTLV